MELSIVLLVIAWVSFSPCTHSILIKSWKEPWDIHETQPRKISLNEKIFIYFYITIFGPFGLLIALMSR